MKSAIAAPRRGAEIRDRIRPQKVSIGLDVLGRSERRLHANGCTPLQAVLQGQRKRAYAHFPEDDVCDGRTNSQYFFHAHPDRSGESGHFHLFLRRQAVPPAILRRKIPVSSEAGQDGSGMVHLGGISLDRKGMPMRLFTTNLWVTGGDFYFAEDTLRLLERFSVFSAITREPSAVVNQWVSALAWVFHGHFALLLEQRDQVMAAWARRHPDRNVFEEKSLEMPSVMRIDYSAQIRLITQSIGRHGSIAA